jgi:hypothetical protein
MFQRDGKEFVAACQVAIWLRDKIQPLLDASYQRGLMTGLNDDGMIADAIKAEALPKRSDKEDGI